MENQINVGDQNTQQLGENSTPEIRDVPEDSVLRIVIFALDRLKDDSARNEGIWGIVNRATLSTTINEVKRGKAEKSVPWLRRAANRFNDLKTLDSQLALGRPHLDPSASPFYKKALFYEATAVLVELMQTRREVTQGKQDLGAKQSMERVAEVLLKGKVENPNLGQPERLLKLIRQLKGEIWPAP